MQFISVVVVQFCYMVKKNTLRYGLSIFVALLVLVGSFSFMEISFGDTEPEAVDWNITSFFSDEYSINELRFVWSGDTGSAADPSFTNGGTNNGTLSTSYDSTESRLLQVYAINIAGEQVSAPIFCEYEEVVCGNGFIPVNGGCVPAFSGSCLAYDNSSATGNPKLFFGQGESVYWRASASGGDDPYTFAWSGDASGTSEIVGPYTVGPGGDYVYSDIDAIYTATVLVADRQAEEDSVSCSIRVKECDFDAECSVAGEICRLDTYTCGPPLPVIIEPLYLKDPVINLGQQCDMSWEVVDAFTCELFKNGVRLDDPEQGIINGLAPTSTDSLLVDPGSYLLQCENEIGESITAGPARCLLNPQIRET